MTIGKPVKTEKWGLSSKQLEKVRRGERVALPDNHPLASKKTKS